MSIVNIQSPFDAFKATLEATGHPLQQRPGTITDAAGRACTKWIGPCPHHGGRSRNSLAVFEHVDGHFWAYCHGGCAPEQILSKVGLTPRDCWPAALRGGWDDATFELLIKAEIAAGSPWPVLREEAMIGLAGDFVRAVEPHTEADPAGLLVQFLVLFGVMVDRRPHLVLNGGRHGLNEFVALVGEASKGRKGTAWSHVEAAFEAAFDRVGECVISGLTSGEGLIWEVRDPVEKLVKDAKGMRVELVEAGVQDTRRRVMEHELSRVLRTHGREGNTLSAIERDAWDGRVLRSLVKHGAGQRTGAVKATGAHISIIGHITREELRRSLSETDAANGYGNRYMWICTRRSKVLSRGGGRPNLGDVPARLHALRLWVD